MQSFTKFDKDLKQAVSQTARGINPSEDMFADINKRIQSGNEGVYYMRNGRTKKTRGLLAACVLLVLTTVTCFAAIRIVDYTGSLENKFESYPSERQMEKVAGFVPKYIDEFENGYKFKEAFVGEYEGKDAAKNTLVMLKSADFTYLKSDAEVYLYMMEKPEGVEFDNGLDKGQEITVAGDQNVYYYDYLNKLKPADYVMTEQDKMDEANGTYVFSFGENYDCINHIQMLGWEEDGISYSLECYDDKLTQDELIKMVKEIIES